MIKRDMLVVRPKDVVSLFVDCRERICSDITSRFGLDVNIQFRDDVPVTKGQMDDTVHPIQVDVGVGDLLPKHKFDFRKLDGKDVVRPIINMFHEAEHVHQYVQFHHVQHPTNEDVYLAVNRIARENNDLYYLYPENYYHNPREIRAEQAGVMDAYEYLCDSFPDVDEDKIEQLMLDYVNDRAKNEYYYLRQPLGKPFVDILDVNKAFDIAFEESKTSRRMYMQRNNDDFVGDLLWNQPEWDEVSNLFFSSANYGYMQDKLVAAVNLYFHPDYIKDYPCIRAKGLNLSGEALFGMPFPDNKVAGAVVHGIENAHVSKSSNMVLNRVRGDVSGSRPLPSFSEHMSDDGDYGNSGPDV